MSTGHEQTLTRRDRAQRTLGRDDAGYRFGIRRHHAAYGCKELPHVQALAMIDIHEYDREVLKVVCSMTPHDMATVMSIIDMHYALLLGRCGVKNIFIHRKQ